MDMAVVYIGRLSNATGPHQISEALAGRLVMHGYLDQNRHITGRYDIGSQHGLDIDSQSGPHVDRESSRYHSLRDQGP